MFKALLFKEWRQLRVLRWVGLGLGAFLPPFLLAVAEAAKRGRLPFGQISDYSVEQLFTSALPLLAAGLWVFLALLFTAQSFAGDRAAGTEPFLLERPVPRARIWWARLAAALASLLLLILVHVLLWIALARLLVGGSGTLRAGDLLILAGAGALVGLVGFVAGVAAASLVASPIQAVLLGFILAAIPPGLSLFLAGLSPLAQIGRMPVGVAPPWLLLLPGYLLASYLICCRGEPAGRGRLRRGLAVLGTCAVAIPVLFLILVPWLLRARAADFAWPDLVMAEGGGRALCVTNGSWRAQSGWIVDTGGRRLRFLGPPVERAAWNRDGTRLAVAHQAGSLGAYSSGTNIDFFDDQGRAVGRSVRLPADEINWVRDLRWVGPELLAAVQEKGQTSTVLVIAPDEGVLHRVPIGAHTFLWRLAGPTADGEVFVHLAVDTETRRYELHRLDLSRAAIDPEPLLEEQDVPTWVGRWISPSGRYWLRRVGEGSAGFHIVGLRDGMEWPLPDCLWARWTEGDRFACLESSGDGPGVTLGSPGEPREEIGSWPGASVTAEVSPGGGRLLLQVWDGPRESGDPDSGSDRLLWSDGRGWRVGERLHSVLVYEVATGALTDVTTRWERGGPTAERSAVWAGPERLAFVGERTLALAELHGTESPRFVFGHP